MNWRCSPEEFIRSTGQELCEERFNFDGDSLHNLAPSCCIVPNWFNCYSPNETCAHVCVRAITPHLIDTLRFRDTVVELKPIMGEKEDLLAQGTAAGEKVRHLKASGAPKDEVTAAVSELLAIKAKYKEVTGEDYPAPAKQSSKKDKKAEAPAADG